MKTRTATIRYAASCPLIAALALAAMNPTASASRFSDSPHAYKGGFMITGDEIVPDSHYAARVRVLGTEISYGGQYEVPVTLSVHVGSEEHTVFGAPTSPVNSAVSGARESRDFVFDSTFAQGVPIWIEARSWVKHSTDLEGSVDDDWGQHMGVNSSGSSQFVLALRDGDSVPDIPAFMNQAELNTILRDYINPLTNKVTLYEDEVIYLFELGTTNLSSSAADFQDLVVLVSLAQHPQYFTDEPDRPRLGLLFD